MMKAKKKVAKKKVVKKKKLEFGDRHSLKKRKDDDEYTGHQKRK
jgi:hypothetical protein